MPETAPEPVAPPAPQPEPAVEVAQAEPQPAPEPYPQPEPVYDPVVETAAEVAPQEAWTPQPQDSYPQPAPIVLGSSLAYATNPDAAFTLTPASEVSIERSPDDALRVDLPEAANESGPGLFDVAPSGMVLEGAPARPLVSEDYVRRLVQQDEMALGGFDPAFDDAPIEPVRFEGLPLILTGVGGIALMAGGMAVGFTAGAGDGLLSVSNIGWLLSLGGIAMTGFSVWVGLNKFLGAPLDDEDEEVAEAESEPRE